MTACEPNFLDVCEMLAALRILILQFSQSFSFVGLLSYLLHLTPFQSMLLFLGRRPVEKVWLETNTMFVQSQRMPEGLDMGIKSSKRQPFRNHAN